MTRVLTRTTLVVAALVAATTLLQAAPAQAMNPAQSQASGVVVIEAQWYGGVNDYWRRTFAAWGRTYTPPRLYYYDPVRGPNYSTPCGRTQDHANNGFYCTGTHAIYLDYAYMQRLLGRYGDYAVGGFVAHEWGHAIDRLLGYSISTYHGEWHADCLAGMATRYGYATGRLTGADYWEFSNWYLSTPWSSTHGAPTTRAAAFKYGYQTGSLASCNQVWRW